MSDTYPFQQASFLSPEVDLDFNDRNWNNDMSYFHNNQGPTIPHSAALELSLFQDPDLLNHRYATYNPWNNVPALATTTPALPAAVPFPVAQAQLPIVCLQPGCLLTFARDSDRTRHETTIHGINRGLHLCPIPGCPRSQGRSYSRPDKVKEHLWKKHADLGYTKGR